MQIETLFNTDDIKRFYFPGRIVVGSGVIEQAIALCREVSGPVAMVADKRVYDLPFVSDALSGLKDCITSTYFIQGAPITQDVEQFVGSMDVAPSVVLVLGGGSATDFAKAIVASLLFGKIDGVGLDGTQSLNEVGVKPMLVCIPTTAGSGAEASRYFVTYDRADHHKVFGKSWSLVADWIVLDPMFLESMPDDILVACAFDAFVHFFETFIARHEHSNFGDMLSLDGIPKVMDALNSIVIKGERDDEVYETLLTSATMAGIGISNIRTGNIHEAAGALLELTDLSHPETLFVFFREAIKQYVFAIRDREELLLSHLHLKPAFTEFQSLEDVICWWEMMFERVGLNSRIRLSIKAIMPLTEKSREHIFQRVYTDKVWITKESPVTLDEHAIMSLIDSSLSRFAK